MANSSSSFAVGRNLPPPQSSFVDPKTGVLSDDGYQWLLSLLNQIAQAWPTATIDDGLSAKGTTQATALQLAKQWNVITSASAGNTGVLLSSLQAGQAQTVFNASGSPINVFPPAGAQIDAQAVNTPFSLADGARQTFDFLSSTQIQT